jgi:hypothetical protein
MPKKPAAKHGYEAAQEFVENELLNLDPRCFVRLKPWLSLAAAFAIGYVAAQIVRCVP